MDKVDSFRWLPRWLVTYYRNMDLPRREPIPWTRPERSLGESRVAVVTTAGVHLKEDEPFDVERERREPYWGDPSYRVLPANVEAGGLAASHLHYDTSDVLADPDVVFPVPLLRDLEKEGIVGSLASRHYSFMGFQLDPGDLLQKHLPKVVASLREDGADVAVLTPA